MEILKIIRPFKLLKTYIQRNTRIYDNSNKTYILRSTCSFNDRLNNVQTLNPRYADID